MELLGFEFKVALFERGAVSGRVGLTANGSGWSEEESGN